jgi:hypothetical protein
MVEGASMEKSDIKMGDGESGVKSLQTLAENNQNNFPVLNLGKLHRVVSFHLHLF